MSVTKNTQRNYYYKKMKVIKGWAKKAGESEIYSSVLNRLISGMTQQKNGSPSNWSQYRMHTNSKRSFEHFLDF